MSVHVILVILGSRVESKMMLSLIQVVLFQSEEPLIVSL